ncbi:MAG: response regulator, partial [Solirubrobacteraceae bacterium]
ASLREVVVGALGSAGYATSTAAHGITASQMLRSAEGSDIGLLDIGLPFVDGWQILAQMEDRRCPAVIVISARGEETDKVRALDLGADDYLTKRFGADERWLEYARCFAACARFLERRASSYGARYVSTSARERCSATAWRCACRRRSGSSSRS